jgi:hypothetical protein
MSTNSPMYRQQAKNLYLTLTDQFHLSGADPSKLIRLSRVRYRSLSRLIRRTHQDIEAQNITH